ASLSGLSALNRSMSPNAGDWLNEASSRKAWVMAEVSFMFLSPARVGQSHMTGKRQVRSPYLLRGRRRDYTNIGDSRSRFRYKGRSSKFRESSVLSLSFPSPRRSLSRCSRGEYFTLFKSVTFGNCPHRLWSSRARKDRRVFSEGGGSGILRLGGHKCPWHRHRPCLTGMRLFETLEPPCLRGAGGNARSPLFSRYSKRYRTVTAASF